jgi:8-oxo-dGTP diphosphatase
VIWSGETFHGAKLLLFAGQTDMIILERDNSPGILWPGCFDFPGGGREGLESPEDCARRETYEELGLRVAALTPVLRRESPRGVSFFFAAHLPEQVIDQVRFGDEGAGWHVMPWQDFLASDRAIPHFKDVLRIYKNAGISRQGSSRQAPLGD